MAIVTYLEHELVRKRRVIQAEEFLHLVGLSQLFRLRCEQIRGYPCQSVCRTSTFAC